MIPKHQERDFVLRTLATIEQYDKYVMGQVAPEEQFEVTLLINSLLGVLVVVNEKYLEAIPLEKLDRLSEWGLSEGTVRSWGTHARNRPKEEQETLREFVRRVRNAIAHQNVAVLGDEREIVALTFTDDFGFTATIRTGQLRRFVTKLATTLVAKIEETERDRPVQAALWDQIEEDDGQTNE